jgi:hypothetical protein
MFTLVPVHMKFLCSRLRTRNFMQLAAAPVISQAVKMNEVFQWQEAYLLAAHKKTDFARKSSDARDCDISQGK